LLLLADEPRNGYAIMQAIEERSGGVWRPSPGSVYPALSQLEDEGLVQAEERDGGRVFRLTDAGRAYVDEHRAELAARWDLVNDSIDDRVVDMMHGLRELAAAAAQLSRVGTPDQIAEAARLIEASRRSIYRMLAGDEPAPPSGGTTV
jgi:DNA-binding PadR family transcriptional regulator